MKINWPLVRKVTGGAFATVCVLVLFTVLTFCSGPACTSSVRTTPATASVVETTKSPDGTVKVRQATSTTTSGSASGDTSKMNQKTGAPTVEVGPDGIRANGGTSDANLSAKLGGVSLFIWAAIVCIFGGCLLSYLGQIRPGLYAMVLGGVFALCATNPLWMLLVAAVAAWSLFHNGIHFEGMRALIATAKDKGVWDTIKSGLHKNTEFGDNAAIKSAEKAEV